VIASRFSARHEHIYIYIRCTTLHPPFFFRNSRLYCKKLVIHCPSLATTFSHLSGSIRIPCEKTGHLLKLSTNRSNFLLLHKTGSAWLSQAILIETSDSQREQRLENTTDGVGLPISTFPSMS